MQAGPVVTISAQSQGWLDRMISNLGHLDAPLAAEGAALMAALTDALKANVAKEFSPHNKTGATLGTLTSSTHGLAGAVTMAGGAPYIEYGTRDHGPTSAKALHWSDSGGEHFSAHVKGITADDFAGRAIDRTDLDATIGGAFADAFLVAVFRGVT